MGVGGEATNLTYSTIFELQKYPCNAKKITMFATAK
jgi:hypothetical protein